MSQPVQLFAAFIAMGLTLIALELFVPGGILGIFGALALMVAIVLGFFAFGPEGGFLAAICIVLFSAIVFALWVYIFPKTKIGKVLTLQKDGHDFKSANTAPSPLLGKEGTALSNLQLSGIAQIDGHRTDVVAESDFIAAGTKVKVVKVEGNRIVVRESNRS
ncbi:MAG: hypothetical protein H3C50_07395 [Kiritimatiellae bacterium]|nr:hypothetical protein [Kiritimatiellia bacterium]